MPDGGVGAGEITEILRIMLMGTNGAYELLKDGGSALKGLGKGAWNAGKIGKMKLKLALHHHRSATETNYNCLSLKTLEKKTGGDYGIVRIPTEDKEDIAKFCNMLKKRKVDASVLPDLNIGDGYTEIAYDPSQVQQLDSVKKGFDHYIKEKSGIDVNCENIDFEEYYNNAKPEAKKQFFSETIEELKKQQAQAEENLKKRQAQAEEKLKKQQAQAEEKTPSVAPKEANHTEDVGKVIDIHNIKSKFHSNDFFQMTVPKAALVAETENSYAIKVPNSYDDINGEFLIMGVDKKNINVDKDTINIAIPKNQQSVLKSSKNTKTDIRLENKDLFKKYFNADTTKHSISKSVSKSQDKTNLPKVSISPKKK